MEGICSKCGGKMITGRLMTGAHLVGFSPLEDEKKLRPRYAGVICEACPGCGSIENIRIEKTEVLK